MTKIPSLPPSSQRATLIVVKLFQATGEPEPMIDWFKDGTLVATAPSDPSSHRFGTFYPIVLTHFLVFPSFLPFLLLFFSVLVLLYFFSRILFSFSVNPFLFLCVLYYIRCLSLSPLPQLLNPCFLLLLSFHISFAPFFSITFSLYIYISFSLTFFFSQFSPCPLFSLRIFPTLSFLSVKGTDG